MLLTNDVYVLELAQNDGLGELVGGRSGRCRGRVGRSVVGRGGRLDRRRLARVERVQIGRNNLNHVAHDKQMN